LLRRCVYRGYQPAFDKFSKHLNVNVTGAAYALGQFAFCGEFQDTNLFGG
jgi:hypothetical protein